MVTSSSDVPMKGLVPLLEAVAKLRTERAVELVVIGNAPPGGRVAQGHRPARACRRRAVRERHLRRGAGPTLRRGPGGGGAVAVRGLLAAGHRGHGLRGAGGRHHRRGSARGGGRDGETGLLVPPDDPGAWPGPSPGSSTTPRWPRLGAGRRQRVLDASPGRSRPGDCGQCYRAVLAGRPLPGAPVAPGSARLAVPAC